MPTRFPWEGMSLINCSLRQNQQEIPNRTLDMFWELQQPLPQYGSYDRQNQFCRPHRPQGWGYWRTLITKVKTLSGSSFKAEVNQKVTSWKVSLFALSQSLNVTVCFPLTAPGLAMVAIQYPKATYLSGVPLSASLAIVIPFFILYRAKNFNARRINRGNECLCQYWIIRIRGIKFLNNAFYSLWREKLRQLLLKVH